MRQWVQGFWGFVDSGWFFSGFGFALMVFGFNAGCISCIMKSCRDEGNAVSHHVHGMLCVHAA